MDTNKKNTSANYFTLEQKNYRTTDSCPFVPFVAKKSRLRLKKATSDQKSLPRMARIKKNTSANYFTLEQKNYRTTDSCTFVPFVAKKTSRLRLKKSHQWH